MPLSLLAVMAVPLLSSLGILHARFAELEKRQRGLIALDNAAIVFGQAEREALNVLARAARRLRQLDLAHHPLHVCARVPATRLACEAPDRVQEALMQGVYTQARAHAVWVWQAATARVLAQIGKSGVRVRWSRRALPGVRETRCGVCGRVNGWERMPGEITRVVSTANADRSLKVEVVGDWQRAELNYEVREATGAF